MGGLIEWLEAAGPPAPEEFASWLEPSADVDVSPEALAREAASALTETLRGLGSGREGAFHLLAADAWATYACEVAADETDVPRALERVLELLGSGGA